MPNLPPPPALEDSATPKSVPKDPAFFKSAGPKSHPDTKPDIFSAKAAPKAVALEAKSDRVSPPEPMEGEGEVENTAETIEDYQEKDLDTEPPQEEVPETDVPEIEAEIPELGLAGEGQFGEGDGGEGKEEEVMEDDPVVEG